MTTLPRTTSTIRRVILPLLLLAVATLTGCASTDDGATIELPAAFDDGVPAPVGEVVLTLEGPDGSVDWDMAALDALDQHELTIVERFVEQEITFTGPMFDAVVLASGISPDAMLELVALDDYTSSLPTDPEQLAGVMLATAADGEPIEIADGGPIRLVYPDGHALAENANNWIWSLRSGTQR